MEVKMNSIRWSLAVMLTLTSTSVASDTLADAFKDGKTSGQIRTFYIDRTYTGVKKITVTLWQ